MPTKIAVWRMTPEGTIKEVGIPHENERSLQSLIAIYPDLISDNLAIIGHEVTTGYGTSIDLLGIDSDGNLVIIELKKDRGPRDIVAQIIEYGSWVAKLSLEDIDVIFKNFKEKFKNKLMESYENLGDLFVKKFDRPLDEVEVNTSQNYIILVRQIDDKLMDIINYLKEYGINIQVILYNYLKINNDSYFIFLKMTRESPKTLAKDKGRKLDYYRKIINEKIMKHQIEELFNYALNKLSSLFDFSRPQLSTYTFYARLTEGLRAILRLNIDESNREKGLKIEIYTKRFANLLNISEEQVKDLIPSEKVEKWSYVRTSEEYSGVAWYAKNENEIDEFINRVLQIKKI